MKSNGFIAGCNFFFFKAGNDFHILLCEACTERATSISIFSVVCSCIITSIVKNLSCVFCSSIHICTLFYVLLLVYQSGGLDIRAPTSALRVMLIQ